MGIELATESTEGLEDRRATLKRRGGGKVGHDDGSGGRERGERQARRGRDRRCAPAIFALECISTGYCLSLWRMIRSESHHHNHTNTN